MIERLNKKVFPFGLVLFALALAVYKAVLLNLEIGAAWQTALVLAGLDLFFIALVLLMAILHALPRGSAIAVLFRITLRALLLLMTGIYLIDSFVLLAVDDRPALFDIGRYAMEWGVVESFFDVWAYGAILLLLICLFYVRVFTPALRNFSLGLLAVTFLWGVLSAVHAPPPLLRYAMLNPVGLIEDFRYQQPAPSYSLEQMDFYSGLKRESVEIPESRPDIILLVVESLSSINSMKVSGSGNLLNRFDELSAEGLLFTNFFANHQASEGGIIALLSGFPPLHFPTATPYMFDEFAIQPAVTAEYQQRGYFTEFLTNSDLKFIGLNHYLDGLGFDRSRGRDEVEAMRAAPRIVQGAPADNLLYTEAAATVRQLAANQRPFLLVLATSSTHLPYTHPQDGPDTAEAVWDWSLQQLLKFYRQLSDDGYFDRGVLMITGDHRQMRPLTQVETDRYGDSARARVPLLVIGKNYPRGVIDERFFQQSDLLRMPARISKPETPLSPQPVWVERYNRKYGRVERIDRFSVYDQQNRGRREYPLKMLGNRIEWLQEKPTFFRSVEARTHAQRSLHQQIRNGATKSCNPGWANNTLTPSNHQGLELGIFAQAGLDGVLSYHSLPPDRKRLAETVAMSGNGDLMPDNVLLFTGFIDIEEAGVFRFRVGAGQTACLSLDKKLVLDQHARAAAHHEISVELGTGLHFLDLRLSGSSLHDGPVLEWIKPGTQQWRWTPVPAERFFMAEKPGN